MNAKIWKYVQGMIPYLILVILFLIYFEKISRETTAKNLATKAHVEQAMQLDKNCNECHIGKNFIQIFKNSNDNVADYAMKKAGIRRW